MQILSLEEAKLHLRVTDNSENTVIQIYIDTAQDYIMHVLEGKLSSLEDSPPAWPPRLRLAALLLVGDYYENRQAQVQSVNDLKRNRVADDLIFSCRENLGL